MYCLRVKILTLVTIGYIVGFIVGMYIVYCLSAQVVVLDIYCIYWTVWDRYMQVLYLGRAPRTKETLPDFLKWCRVTRHPLVFRGLTGSQRTPGFWGVIEASPVQGFWSSFPLSQLCFSVSELFGNLLEIWVF